MSEAPARARQLLPWAGSGALLLGGLALMALRSAALSPQQTPAQRPLPFFLICYAVSWIGFLLAFRMAAGGVSRAVMTWILAVALLGRVLFLPTALIQSDDSYRYVLDGHSLLAGINPYRYTPAQIARDPPEELLRGQRSAALAVIRSVNNPDVSTIYPPLAQCAFALGATLSPWDILGQRIVFLCCDLATMAALLYLLRRLSMPLSQIVIYAWNPLVIKEISNTAHADSLVGLCIVVLSGLLLVGRSMVEQGGPAAHFGWAFFSGLCCGAAILAKLYPLLLIPLCLAWLYTARWALLTVPVFVVAVAMYVVPAYLMFLDVPWSQVTAGLRTYSAHWLNNAGLFLLVDHFFVSPRLICRILTVGLIGAVAIWLALRRRSASSWVAAVQVSLLWWFLLLPTCFPWYVVGLVAVSVLRPKSWVVVLTGVLGLYYVVQYAGYRPEVPLSQGLIQLIEHGVIIFWLLFEIVRSAARSRSRQR